MVESPTRTRPLGVLGSAGLFFVPAAILYSTHYFLIPAFVGATGVPYFLGYLIGWPFTMALFLVAALVGYAIEGHQIEWSNLARRFRLTTMPRQDWLWALGLLLISMLLYFGLGFTSEWLARLPLFAPHPLAPADFGPGAATARVPGYFMGMSLSGEWWIAVVFVVGWVLNTFGEELWFRGYVLPRQELAMGRWAWIANGIMFALNHVWQPWNLLLVGPSALLGAYVVQKRQNTWILILMHGLMNLTLVVLVVLNVAGVSV